MGDSSMASTPTSEASTKVAFSPPSSPRKKFQQQHSRSISESFAVSSVGSTDSLIGSEIILRDRAWRRDRAAATARDVFLFLLALRVLNALCVRTFFQPDEYFQALEPAWRIAFGESSGAWITWVR